MIRVRAPLAHRLPAHRDSRAHLVRLTTTSLSLLAQPGAGDPPDRSPRVIGDKQRAIFRDRERRWAAPDLGALRSRCPEAGREVLVMACGAAILERHAHDLAAGRV